MDKALDRFGFYDLFSVFSLGVTCLVLTDGILRYWYGIVLPLNVDSPQGVLTYLILSYLTGLILQELGCVKCNLFKKRTSNKPPDNQTDHKRDTIDDQTDHKRDTLDDLENHERDTLRRLYEAQEPGLKPAQIEAAIYQCATYAMMKEEGIEIRALRFQAIATFSRSLGLYMMLVSIVALGHMLFAPRVQDCCFAIVAILLGQMLWNREKRFMRLRRTTVLRAYYHLVYHKDKVAHEPISR